MYANFDKYPKEPHARKHHKNPSFSSVLLDEILNSIDKDNQAPSPSSRKTFNHLESKSFTTTSRSSSSGSSFSSGFSFASKTEYPSKKNRAATIDYCYQNNRNNIQPNEPIIKNGENFVIKSKSRAMKIYSNLKKVKQPISPGGRLSSFINSLFTSESSKKMKNKNDVNFQKNPKSTSSASSCSRSCLTKKGGMNSKAIFDNGGRRKVRFLHGSSMVLDGDSHQGFERSGDMNVEDYDSDCSEDLFEIDHLGVFGNERFYDELPVYGTTHVHVGRSHIYKM